MKLELGIALVAVAAVTWVLVGAIKRYAMRRLLDIPGARSSHATPTPRGGGLAIVIASLGAAGVATALDAVPPATTMALVGGGALVAAIGFLDDHGGVPAMVRFGCHFAAFVWVSFWLGPMPAVDFGWGPVDLPVFWSAAALFYLLWFLNLFNFMDGIDGIAGVQAVAMTGVGAALLVFLRDDVAAALLPLLLAAATLGFLVWNWPPAKIFMGDVGSGFLGLALGVIGYSTVAAGDLTVWVWLILGAVFVADASVTLFRRIARGEKLSDAHRTHAYQRLSRRLGSHRTVTLLVLAVDLVWLAPLSLLATWYPAAGAVLTAIAWGSLFLVAWRLGAGELGELTTQRSRL